MLLIHDENGGTAIEAALILPFYLAITFVIIELGNIYWAYNSIQFAADEAARCNAINASCDAKVKAYNSALGIWPSQSAANPEISVLSSTTCGTGTGAYTGTQVTITHSVSSLTGYFPDVMPSPLSQIAVQSCYPNPA